MAENPKDTERPSAARDSGPKADPMVEKVTEVMATRYPSPTDVAVQSFHAGVHPQRPIAPDITEEEEDQLNRERDKLHAPGSYVGEDRDPAGTGPTIPGFRPAAGRLFTGYTEDEEMALRGIDPKVWANVHDARATRLEEGHEGAKKAREAEGDDPVKARAERRAMQAKLAKDAERRS